MHEDCKIEIDCCGFCIDYGTGACTDDCVWLAKSGPKSRPTKKRASRHHVAEILGALLGIAGMMLVAQGVRMGFHCLWISSICWVFVGLEDRRIGMVVLSLFYIAAAMMGLLMWKGNAHVGIHEKPDCQVEAVENPIPGSSGGSLPTETPVGSQKNH